MEFFNVLATSITVYGDVFDVHLNFIGKLIKILVSGVGSVGVGIILFSLILKLITLPFDVYQRIAMRKQNIKLKENQEKMEKLQKQYANNKELYNQKVMEMYKASGFSMFSSCLPMILSMIIFFVAIGAFNAYSQYSNIENYNTMVRAYNDKIEYYCPELTQENIDGFVKVENGMITVRDTSENNDKCIYYTLPYSESFETDKLGYIQKMSAYSEDDTNEKKYYVDEEKAMKIEEISSFVTAQEGVAQGEALQAFFRSKAQEAVVKAYDNKVTGDMGFLWIKNIWVTDASYKHPVLTYKEFSQEVSREKFSVNGEKKTLSDINYYTNAYKSENYDTITAKLDDAKNQANGYFVLIVLSIGTILLQQFVMMRSQKEQQKYSTVDGQGASQQKMTMVIMTAMFAIFSFMYSSAFSIYMIVSNLFSMLSTLIINKAVDASAAKKEEEAFRAKHTNIRTPKTDDKKKKK
ncbi:MAG: membrane protein insertase YidC [Clostridiales bacterium]|nr:membrane protein insertase YidC [Clostridiales bacterium]